MPGTKISALTTLSALVDASVLPVVDSSTNYKMTGSVLATYTTSKIPTASTTVLGLVKVDGTSITINGSGVISGASTLTTPIIATSITTDSTTFALLNTTATTVNFAGAATTALNIGASNAPITGFVSTATSTSTAASLGYLGMPQNSKSSPYSTVIGDAGKHIYVTTSTTITIDGSVAYPVGTTIGFISANGATTTIAIGTDTLYLGGTGTTGSRALAAYGMATAVKVESGKWFISGNGLT